MELSRRAAGACVLAVGSAPVRPGSPWTAGERLRDGLAAAETHFGGDHDAIAVGLERRAEERLRLPARVGISGIEEIDAGIECALDELAGHLGADLVHRAYPDVSVEIDVNDAAIDLTANGFDAGIRIGEAVARDMIAIRLTEDVQWSVVGTPGYFARHGRPSQPEELTSHECVNFRFPASGVLYRWEFEREGREFSIDVPCRLIVNDSLLLKALALADTGLIYTAHLAITEELAAGRLERVLQRYVPRTPGLYLHFPARSRMQSKLRAFVEAARAFAQRPSAAASGIS